MDEKFSGGTKTQTNKQTNLMTDGPYPVPRGDTNEIDRRNLNIFSRTTGPISAQLGTKHPWVKGI